MYLNRLVEIDNDGLPIVPYFAGYRDLLTGHSVQGDEFRRVLELFLVGHLGHPVSVIDTEQLSDVVNELDDLLFDSEAIDSGASVFHWVTDPTAFDGCYEERHKFLGTEALINELRRDH